MFLLNTGRYVVADPEISLGDATLKKLWGSSTRFGSFVLKTANGTILALPTGKSGQFLTDMGVPVTTASAHIAFLPCMAAEKLLPYGVIRFSLQAPAMLFYNEEKNIVLDGKLTIFIKSSARDRIFGNNMRV